MSTQQKNIDRNIFTVTNIQCSANLKWGIVNEKDVVTQFFNIAEGYKSVCLSTLGKLIKDNQRFEKDRFIFPILFNAMHAIELYLKTYNYIAKELTNNNQSKISDGGHNLNNLCDTALVYTDKIKEPKTHQGLTKIKEFISLMTPIFTTGMSYTLRYSVDKEENPYKYITATNETWIDLPKLQAILTEDFEFIGNAVTYLAEQLDVKKS